MQNLNAKKIINQTAQIQSTKEEKVNYRYEEKRVIKESKKMDDSQIHEFSKPKGIQNFVYSDFQYSNQLPLISAKKELTNYLIKPLKFKGDDISNKSNTTLIKKGFLRRKEKSRSRRK